jgi:hypothetical protein
MPLFLVGGKIISTEMIPLFHLYLVRYVEARDTKKNFA